MSMAMKITLCLSVWEFPQSVMFFIMSRNDSPSVKRYYVELIKVSLIFMACSCAKKKCCWWFTDYDFLRNEKQDWGFLICC